MNRPFKTDLSTFRTSYRADLINNQYEYIGGDTYQTYVRTQILEDVPDWYNVGVINQGGLEGGADYQNDSTMIRIHFHEDEIDANIADAVANDNDNGLVRYFDNYAQNWVMPDNSLHGRLIIVTNVLNENTLNAHLDSIREHHHYDNLNEIINNVRQTLLPYINAPYINVP
tara:strand:+ start:410 stop:922 length:513 start_codon:yes stop_codon:yes gene_type:complete